MNEIDQATTPRWDRYLGPRGIPQALRTVTVGQLSVILLLLVPLVICLFLDLKQTLIWTNAIVTCLFLLATLYRFHLVDLSLRQRREIVLTADELIEPEGGWPRYVIQVPLYQEPFAVRRIVRALSKLDYPVDRLSIQLLVEDDDEETKGALGGVTLPPQFKIVPIPVCEPRTKPKACNVGLAEAEGDFLVIYDAEDRPEPDQLKKAAIGFERCADKVACVQAKLCFFNSRQNLLTRMFTADYALWFGLCLPGLDSCAAPIPLGGTSNHFRLSVLRELEGWDEYNVTEDCDLGIRLAIAGWQTRIVDSTTWEEACPRFGAWIRQRSRWVKGYVQTYLVHLRRPLHLTRSLGLGRSLHVHLLVGGSVLTQLLGLVYWAMVLVWGATHTPLLDLPSGTLAVYFPGPVFAMGAFCLFVGNFLFAYYCGIACVVRKMGHIVPACWLMPVYWMVMSFAAWKGALQLIWRPHYWEKTAHFDTGESE